MTVEKLQSIPLLSELEANILSACMKQNRLSFRHFSKGTTVHHQGDVCDMLDVVLSGSLVAYSLSENGSAITMFEFYKNSIIGANLLFGDNHAYPLNIYSVTDCELLQISRSAVLEFLHEHAFVMKYIKSLSLNSQGLNRKITMLTQKTLRDNILDYLKQQSYLQGKRDIILPVTKKELADYLGVQRPSLFRELKKLQEEGFIKIENRRISVLLDFPSLG